MVVKEDLYEQLYTKPFRSLLFTVYNLIEDEGFVAEASNELKRTCDIDDFEFMKFDISADDMKLIKNKDPESINSILSLKRYIEKEKQKGFAFCRIYIVKDIGSVIAVRLKNG